MTTDARVASPAATLDRLCERYWEDRMRYSPLTATSHGNREHDHLVPDLHPETIATRRGALAAMLAEVEALPEDELELPQRVTRRELRGVIEREIGWIETGQHRYLLNHMFGPQVSLPQIPEVQPLRDRSEADAYLERLQAMGPYIDRFTGNLREGQAHGLTSSRMPARRTSQQLSRLLESPTEEWTLVRHAAGYAAADGPRAREILDRGLRPALARLLAYLLGDLMPATRPDSHPGLVHLPHGREDYARCVRYFTALDTDPQDIHDRGLAEVSRLHKVLLELGGKTLGVRDLRELRGTLEESQDLHFRSAEHILEMAREAVTRATEIQARICNLEPASHCQVAAIPALEAPDAPLAYYRAPAADGSRPGTYYVNTHAPGTKLAIEAEGVAFHEAVPGHHLQIGIAQTLELPTFRRFGGLAAYCEGWALYSEKLSDELGLYSRDLDRLGMLGQDLWRAIRLVLDTGLHALGWSRQEAIDFAVCESMLGREVIENEVDRFVVFPGQALSYKLGEMEVLRLRRQEEARLGGEFDLATFHDRLLGCGAVGLDTLASLFEPRERAA